MPFKYLIYVVCFWSFSFTTVFAQQEDIQIEEQMIEQLIEELETDTDISEFTERLRYYMRHPIDLNKSTEEDLTSLVFLTAMQITNIMLHREMTGDFISILELQGVEGFDIHTIQLLKLFVSITTHQGWQDFTLQNMFSNSKYELMLRYGRTLQQQKGYHIEDENRSRYLGSADRVATRFRMNYEDQIKVSINMDKDAGEPFLRDKQRYGFDFYSASIGVKDIKRVKRMVIGDYALQFGQGLVVWNGLSFGKGASVVSVARQGAGLRQYTSLNESNFMRGIAAVIPYQRWSFTPFFAINNLSGNVVETESAREINTINYSGYHRTPNELMNRHTIHQYVYGVNATYIYKRWKIGATALSTILNGNYKADNQLRNLYHFNGNRLTNSGVFYQYTFRNLFLYGETAHSVGSGFATTNGIIGTLHPKLTAIVSYRNYQKDYHHFFAQSIGESSVLGNEKGVYAGLVYHPSRKIEWVNYVDHFQFPWLRFRADAPTSGLDMLSQFSRIWHKKGRVIFRFRYRLKQENLKLPERNEHLLADVFRTQGRVDFQYKLTSVWSVRSRFELSYYYKESEDEEYGYLAFQDVLWTSRNNKLSGNMRVAYFNTPSFNSRIYTYEQDVLYASSFPAYYRRGFRTYVNCRLRLSRKIDVWARYALSIYPDETNIGSQLEMIDGNRKSDIHAQIRYRWK